MVIYHAELIYKLKMAKRKDHDTTCLSEPSSKKPWCILHTNHKDPGPFTYIERCRGGPYEKLQYLHQIRDKRLCQPLDSTHRMERVCRNLPESIEDECLSSKPHGVSQRLLPEFYKPHWQIEAIWWPRCRSCRTITKASLSMKETTDWCNKLAPFPRRMYILWKSDEKSWSYKATIDQVHFAVCMERNWP